MSKTVHIVIEGGCVVDAFADTDIDVIVDMIYDELEKTYNLTTKSTKSQETFFQRFC